MNLNGRTINPGDLRTSVVLAPRSVSTETGGFQAPTPDTAHQVSAKARWESAHGIETWTAATTGATEPATVLIRYRAMDETWYVSKDAGVSWFEVVTMDDILQRHEYLELKVRRWRPG